MTDLTSIGTLFAFALVSGGVLILPRIGKQKGRFSIPYVNAQFIYPAGFILMVYGFRERILQAMTHMTSGGYQEMLFLIFILITAALSILAYRKAYSLIPLLGVTCCLYLMVEIPADSWLVFFGWMTVGLLIYLSYGMKNSKLVS